MPQNWTHSAAKWAAVAVLGSASVAGVVYSVATGRASIPRTGTDPAITIPADRFAARPTTAPPSSATSAPAQPLPAATAPRPAPEIAPPHAAATDPRVNLNAATAAELELLPGIGPALAKRIIDFRTTSGPFKTVEDLDKVSGIGPKIMQRLRPLVRIE